MKEIDITVFKHKIGEYVVYKNSGICRITAIRSMRFPKMKERVYYICSPIYDESAVIYAPADSEEAERGMRKILTAEEIDSIIASAESIESDLSKDSKERTAVFEEKLLGGDRTEILWLIKVITEEKRQRESQKKKLYAADAKILATAEKIITEEFAFALGISKNEVIPYITDRIKNKL